MTQDFTEGYPPSAPADLDPGADVVERLDDAEREEEAESRVGPEGRRPEGSIEDEDARADAHDVDALDDTQAREHLLGGRGRQDRPNFNDNTADWSRERT